MAAQHREHGIDCSATSLPTSLNKKKSTPASVLLSLSLVTYVKCTSNLSELITGLGFPCCLSVVLGQELLYRLQHHTQPHWSPLAETSQFLCVTDVMQQFQPQFYFFMMLNQQL
jgi:hypothetical protein